MPKELIKEGSQFITRCTKPDQRGAVLTRPAFADVLQNLSRLRKL